MSLILSGLTPAEIAAKLNLEPYQGRQVFRWIHAKRAVDFDAMTDLSIGLRQRLRESCFVSQLTILECVESRRRVGTKKVVFGLQDGETVEAVLLRDRRRMTLCLSTQAGCAVRCAFCATGQFGFKRNLTAGEIVEQAVHLLRGEDLQGRSPNIVYMGMGEPFRNYDATMQSIKLLMLRDGLGIGARRITVSTVGDVPGIRRFSQEHMQVRLSVSLHAANDHLRNELVPMNRQYPLKRLLEAVRSYVETTGRHMTFEWVLLAGVNDSPEDAFELAQLVRRFKASVNLIPYNAVPGLPYARPSRKACELFYSTLVRCGVRATLRQERGGDIEAACGQLRRRVSLTSAT